MRLGDVSSLYFRLVQSLCARGLELEGGDGGLESLDDHHNPLQVFVFLGTALRSLVVHLLHLVTYSLLFFLKVFS